MTFTPDIYDGMRNGCQQSAAVIVPAVIEMVKPHSVIDVGCGEGWFAREFAKAGVEYVAGVDEAQVEGRRDGVTFHRQTLPTNDIAVGDYNLAVCLEVAEHLPKSDAGELVRMLKRAAPVVLFSAAIPGQDGHGHVNCQWPDYWAGLFQRHDDGLGVYFAVDGIRWMFWNDARIESWYRQNMFWAVKAGHPLLSAPGFAFAMPPRVMHPAMWSDTP